MNETIVETNDVEDMIEDNVETDNVKRVDKTHAVKLFEVEKVSRAETFQIGEMWLKICVDIEEDFEGKVKTINLEELKKGYMILLIFI
jgi:hypothetical protein